MKRITKIIGSVFAICAAFAMTTLNVSATEETSTPISTSVVSTEKTLIDNSLPVTTESVDSTENQEVSDVISDVIQIEENELIIPEGNGILLEDVLDGEVNRQFITIQSKNGNTFYIVIDKDSQGRENVYFLNTVDEYDLMEFTEDFPEEVKKENGAAKKPDVTDKNGEPIETVTDSSGNTENNSSTSSTGNNNTLLILIGVLALAGGGAFYYFKFVKGNNLAPKKSNFDIDEDDEEYDDEPTVRDDAED